MKIKITKKATKKVATKVETPWYETAARLPVGLFFTTQGPIIGRVDRAPPSDNQFRVRLWAPAMLQTGLVQSDKDSTVIQQRVLFQPLMFVDTYIDLSTAAPFGTAPVPAAIIPGYEEYFAKFAQGNYGLRRVVTTVQSDTPHTMDIAVPVTDGDAPIDVPEPNKSDVS